MEDDPYTYGNPGFHTVRPATPAEHITIQVPPRNAAEAVAREAYVRASAELRERERRFKRPVWTRRLYWKMVFKYARSLSTNAVDKMEYDEEFGLTSK